MGRRVLPPLVIVLLILVTFMPALCAGFVGWDDDDLVLHETRYRTLTWESVRWMFTTSYTGHFQPLTWFSFHLDYTLWGLEPFGFHLTNVVLHAGTALVFYSMARRWLRAPRSVDAERPGESDFGTNLSAAMAAVLFATHPLRAESVAWIAERRDVLSGFLFLLSIRAYLPYAEATTGVTARRSSLRFYLLALLFCALSLLSKASAITMPLVLIVLDVYPLRRWGSGRIGGARVFTEKLPFLALSLVVGALAIAAQGRQNALVPLSEHGWAARFAQACYGLVFYLRKTVWPVDLGPLYELPDRATLLGSMFGWALLGVMVLTLVAITARKRFPGMTAALVMYAILVAPVLGFAQSGPQLVADRYSYLSCLGFALLGGEALARGMSRSRKWHSGLARAAAILLFAGGFTGLQHATFRQCDIWSSGLTLWSHGVRVSPSSAIAHANLGDAWAALGQLPDAVRHYRRSLELRPHDPITQRHLTVVLRKLGQADVPTAGP